MALKKRLVMRIAALAVVGLVATGLVACSSGGSSDGSTAAAGKNILIGMNSGLVAQFQRYATSFEKTHKGFHVTVKPVPDAQSDYIQQLVTQGLSKSLPDIIFNYDTLNTTLNSNHLLYNIKPWLKSGHDGLKLSSFIPNFLSEYDVPGGGITGIPVSADSGVVYINKTLFGKYGVTVPKADWTYQEMYNDAKQITTKSNGSVYGLQTPLGDATALFSFYPVLRAFGSDLYDSSTKKFIFANADGIKAWTYLLEPYVQKFGTPYSDATKGSALFSGSQTAMSVGSTAGVASNRSTLKDEWDMLPMPSINGRSTTGGGSYSLSISEKSSNKEGAYQFMAWFYSTNGGMKVAQADGVIPATTDGITHGAWLQQSNPVPASYVPTVKASVAKAVFPKPQPAAIQPKVVPALTNAVEEVVLKGESVQQAFIAAQNQLNGLLK